MITVCVTLGGEREARAREHFESVGLTGVLFFHGINGPKLGIIPTHEVPETPEKMPKTLGVWLSHRLLWSALLLLDGPDDEYLIVEDDAKFPADWRERFERARLQAHDDFDALYVGSCCTDDKSRTLVRGNVYEVRFPLCTHAYILRRKALKPMISMLDAHPADTGIDIALHYRVWPEMRVYTVLPRIIDQFDTDMPD